MANFAHLEHDGYDIWVNVDQVVYVRGKGRWSIIVFAQTNEEQGRQITVDLPAADVVESFQAVIDRRHD